MNKFLVDEKKGIINKIIKDKNDNYINNIIDFYPIEAYETTFGQILREVEKEKIIFDNIDEKKRLKQMNKKDQKAAIKQKEKEKNEKEKKLEKTIDKARQLIENNDIKYKKNLITKEEYIENYNKIKKDYSEAFRKPEKTSETYDTEITLNQFIDNLVKYKNNILLEKVENILTFPRDRTNREIKDEILMNNPQLKEKQYDIYYFLFSSKKLFIPDDNYIIGQEENEDFINIIIDIHNNENKSFHQLLTDKEKEIETKNDEEKEKDDKDKGKNKDKNKNKDKDKDKKKEKKKKEKEKEKEMSKEEKKKLQEKKLKEKEEEKKREKLQKEEEKKQAQLLKEMKAKEKEENKKKKQLEKEREREKERRKQIEKYISPPYGINNYGNTCYFNSVNQIFLNLPILQQIFLDPKIDFFVNKTNKF